MSVGELLDYLCKYPDDTPVYIGRIDGHSIAHEDFEVIETAEYNGAITISLMVDDINIIHN